MEENRPDRKKQPFPPDFHTLYTFFTDLLAGRPAVEVLETELLGHLFPPREWGEGSIFRGMDLELFEKHFLLYRRLYLFADELAYTPYRLSIRNIRIIFLRVPPLEKCSFFIDHTVRFCELPTCSESPYCEHHHGIDASNRAQGLLLDTGVRDYYLDLKNLRSMTEERLRRMLSGFYLHVFSPEEVEMSRNLLGVDPGAKSGEIRKRFKELARGTHPDMAAGDHNAFLELRRAYEIVMDAHFTL